MYFLARPIIFGIFPLFDCDRDDGERPDTLRYMYYETMCKRYSPYKVSAHPGLTVLIGK